MKILIIEDEPSLREIMQRALVQERHVVKLPALIPKQMLKSQLIVTTVFYSISCCPTGMGYNY